MIPSFLIRHPLPPTKFPVGSSSSYGLPTAPPIEVRPPNEFSKDFFRNLRDLQNAMDDFSRIYDYLAGMFGPAASFTDEPLSSAVFITLWALSVILGLGSRLLPWRFISLAVGWALTCVGHPLVRRALLAAHRAQIQPRERQLRAWLVKWSKKEFGIGTALETGEVEIFELQRQSRTGEWDPWIFSLSPYDPLEAERSCGHRPTGARFLEDVQPPYGWAWSSLQWSTDLLSLDWVEERFISAVEVETEGERWVYDLPLQSRHYHRQREEQHQANSDESNNDLEEPTSHDQGDRWRRRRWTRLVKRQLAEPRN